LLVSLMLPITVKEKIHIMKSKMILMLGLLTCNNDLKPHDSASVDYVCMQPIVDGEYDIIFETVETTCGSMKDIRMNVVYGVPAPNKNAGCHLTSIQNKTKSCEVGASFDCDDGLWEMKLDWNTKSHSSDDTLINGTFNVKMERFTGWTCEGKYYFHGLRDG